LDLLMLTQGWRRYNIAELAQARFSKPAFLLENAPLISGTVKTLLRGKPVENMNVSIRSYDGDYFDGVVTDKDGRFYFYDSELPDSTRFTVSTVSRKGMTEIELIVDEETFPGRTLFAVSSVVIDSKQLAKYVDKAEQKYVLEHGKRHYLLPEVTVTANRSPIRKTFPYEPPPASNTITEKDIEEWPATTVRDLLLRVPGVVDRGEEGIFIRGGIPMIIVDDFAHDLEYLEILDVYNIAQIDVIKMAGAIPVLGPRISRDNPYVPFVGSRDGMSAILIYTKKGEFTRPFTQQYHIKTISPLGYQMPVEFYAPKYDTPAKQRSPIPDLRTTIHWQPVVQIDDQGAALFEFYTTDDPASYTIVIEGLADNGLIIRLKE